MILARLGDKKQTRRQNMAEIVFSWGVSEIKCIIFIENNDNPYEIYNNYIKCWLANRIFMLSARAFFKDFPGGGPFFEKEPF
jgi:hypothetical protein